METNANPMFKHINATLEEKVEILATNPFRYYLAPNLWIGRNESRIDELISLFKEAEENENFELCARIKEVTKKFRKIFLKNVLVEIVHSDMIKICFTTLVIRIDRINKKYGDLIDFMSEYKLSGVFNEKIYCTSDMSSGQELNNIVRNALNPLGFVENDDYCWLSEQLTVGHDSSSYDIIHKEHPNIKNIDWLGSVILENGNWICFIDSTQDLINKIIPNLFYKYMRRFNLDKLKLNPTIEKITDKNLYFKLENQNELLSFDLNTLFVLSEIRHVFNL